MNTSVRTNTKKCDAVVRSIWEVTAEERGLSLLPHRGAPQALKTDDAETGMLLNTAMALLRDGDGDDDDESDSEVRSFALFVTSNHTAPRHITPRHITSHHITSHRITSHRITSHHITSHHLTSPLLSSALTQYLGLQLLGGCLRAVLHTDSLRGFSTRRCGAVPADSVG